MNENPSITDTTHSPPETRQFHTLQKFKNMIIVLPRQFMCIDLCGGPYAFLFLFFGDCLVVGFKWCAGIHDSSNLRSEFGVPAVVVDGPVSVAAVVLRADFFLPFLGVRKASLIKYPTPTRAPPRIRYKTIIWISKTDVVGSATVMVLL